ncbi:P-loop containing nucleoside triphosphate hydrolase protein [Tricladium varicosporioides]|nr:P-loop containing nucleoside triphosphate hydrolase protein [Hymenoscyphus varicosporioides]
MASQIYSRYVPPAKKQKIAVTAQNPAPPETASPHAAPPQPSARNDASLSYARYIPPSKLKKQTVSTFSEVGVSIADSKSDTSLNKRGYEELGEHKEVVEERKSKKLKKVKEKRKDISNDSGIRETVREAKAVSKSVETTLRKDKRGQRRDITNPAVQDIDEDSSKEDERHKKLMKKREKSLKKAEKLEKKVAKEREAVGEVEEPLAESPPEIHDLIPLPQPEPVPELPTLPISSSLPPWLAKPLRVTPSTTAHFADLGISSEIVDQLSLKGFKEAFAVQAAVLPILLPGSSQKHGDVVVSAATGSGKTLAYALPIVEDISKSTTTKLRGLIVMPTRELVSQAREVLEVCAAAFSSGSRKRVKIGTAVGHETFKAEQQALMDQDLVYDPEQYMRQIAHVNAKWESSNWGSDREDEDLCDEKIISSLENHVLSPTPKIDILICTPGRLVEHLKSTPGFTLEHLQWLVIDEADKLLDQSFQQWLSLVIGGLPSILHQGHQRKRVRKIVLSATMTRDIGQLNELKLYRPIFVMLEGSSSEETPTLETSQAHALPSLLMEAALKVDDESIKPLYLIELLQRENLLHNSTQKYSHNLETSDSDISDDTSSESSSDSSSTNDSSSDSGSFSDKDSKTRRVPHIPKAIQNKDVTLPAPRGVLIFTKSNETAVRLGRLISIMQPKSSNSIATLTSTTRSSTRQAALRSFEAGKLSILIASDLVSRGVDLPNLAQVINYDVPTSVASYIHRVGRTARAGKTGHAWTLFTGSEAWWFWNEIGRSGTVTRSASSKVSRVSISASHFSEQQRSSYQAALDKLQTEARKSKPERSVK